MIGLTKSLASRSQSSLSQFFQLAVLPLVQVDAVLLELVGDVVRAA